MIVLTTNQRLALIEAHNNSGYYTLGDRKKNIPNALVRLGYFTYSGRDDYKLTPEGLQRVNTLRPTNPRP